MAASRLMLQQRAVAPDTDPATIMAACALFAGDDLLLVVADGRARLHYFESDFSAYDASISTGPLSVQYIGFQRWGVPDFVLDVLRAISTSKLRVSGLTIDRSARPQRATGAPDTTCGNGFVTAFATALVVLNDYHTTNGITADSVQAGFAQLGFKAKVRAQESITDCTFLKGLFYPACDSSPVSYQWAPLPSRVIKACKCLSDLRIVYRSRDLAYCLTRYLYESANGYRAYRSVPILGVFVNRYADHAPDTWFQEDHVILPGAVTYEVDRESSLRALAARYGCLVADLEAVEHQLKTSVPMSFLAHPLYEAMLVKDYC
jgi:hypothetical protein